MGKKKNFTISISEDYIKTIKCIAISEGTTASALIEDYIKAIKKNRNTIKAIKDINKEY